MQQQVQRAALLDAVREALCEAPVVALLGARQVGKTTLAAQVSATWTAPTTTFDLEVASVREAVSRTPEALLGACEGLVVIDEVQRLPALFETLRPLCDAANRKAVFLLLGSVSWDVVRGISEALAERVLFVDVGGFSLAEVGTEHQERLWLRGGFPRAWLAPSTAAWRRWMRSFTRTFLERDVPGLGAQVPAEALSRFWRMLAHYHGQVWNAAELGRSMDAGARTVNRYRDLLAGTFMVRVLPPWFENLGKRLVIAESVSARQRHSACPFGLGRDAECALAPALRRQLGGLRVGTDAARSRRARRLLLRHPAGRGAGPAAATSRAALGFRVQVYGRAAHGKVDARRLPGFGAGAPLCGVPREPSLSAQRENHRAASEGDWRHTLARRRAVATATGLSEETVLARPRAV